MKQSRYPLATNISATSGTDTLLGLKEGKTRNFKVSDIVSLAVNSVYISAQDVTSESINVGLTSGVLPWERISNIPFASSTTSGVLSPEDYIILMESGSGGSSSALTNSTITFGNGISATTIYVSANPVAGLNSIVSPGTAIKISYDSYGRVLSGQSLTSADIPNIDMDKVITGQLDWNRISNILFATSSNNGIITSADWNIFNNKISNLNILSAYLPLSGGRLTGTLSGTSISVSDIITNNFYTNYVDFNLSALPSYNTGRLHWDDTDKTLNLDLDDGTVLQIGQETLIRGQNNTGSTILNGSLVYINGSSGNRPTFGLADADIISAGTVIAIATHDITNNNTGFFTTFGLVRQLNTSEFLEGSELYLSTSAGIFTDIEPEYPNKKCSIGYVIRSHSTQGSIFFNTKHISKYDQSITTPNELNYLSTVSANIQTQFGNIQSQINQLSQNSLSGTGAGTVGKISKFITSSSVGDSTISDSGSLVTFSTPITISGDVSAPNFIGLATKATSALQTDVLKTARNFSLSGDITSNVVSFNGSSNVVLSGTINNLPATKITQDTNNRFVTDTQINSWNNAASATINVSAIDISLTSGSLNWNRIISEPTTLSGYGISSADTLFDSKYASSTISTVVQSNSANWNAAFTSAHNHSNKATLDLINQSVNTSANVSFNTISSTNISATSLTIGNISNTEFNYLDTVSANIQTQLGNISALDSTKTPLIRTITTTSGLTGGGDLSTNRTIGLVAVGTSGTYSNFVTNVYGQVTSARSIISADIPTLPASKILEDSNDRFVSDSQISYWNSLSASSFAVSSINIASTSGSLNWNRISAVPVASTNTSGVLTSSDWNTFNNKIGSLSALNNYLPLSGGNINGNVSANNISAITLTVGNISNIEFQYLNNVSANIQTQLTNLSARTITSADIPQLPPSKILEDSNDRFVSDSQINSWTDTTTSVQSSSGNWNSAVTSSHNHPNKSTIDLINQSLNTSANVLFNNISANSFIGSKVLVSNGKLLTESNITTSELNYLSGTTSNIQLQLNQALSGQNLSLINVGLEVDYTTSGNIILSGYEIQSSGTWTNILTSANRILVKNQTSAQFNGVYNPTSGAWNRVSDFNTSANILQNTYFFVVSGTEAHSGWILITTPPYVVGTTSLTFNKVFDGTQAYSNTGTATDISAALITESYNDTLILLSANTSTVASAAPNNTIFAKSLSPIFAGKREKTFTVIGPTSGTYSATVVFYGSDASRTSWVYPDNCIIATINNVETSASASFTNKFIVWGASLTVDSGTIPDPGIIAKVEV